MKGRIKLDVKCKECGETNKEYSISFHRVGRKGKGNFGLVSGLYNENEMVCWDCMVKAWNKG